MMFKLYSMMLLMTWPRRRL